MLKYAYEMGVKIALTEEGLTPAQMSAAQRIGAVGVGGVGALGGSLLGKYLGERAALALKRNPEKAKLLGGLLGGIAGAGIGGFAGHQLPKLMKQREEGMALSPQFYYEEPQMAESPSGYPPEEQSALGLLPSAYNYGGAMPAEYSYYPEY